MKKKILNLRPTQMAAGMKEVEDRLKKMMSFKADELEEYLKTHRVPVVTGPQQRPYLIDHHHLVRACWEAGLTEIPVEVKDDLSHLSWEQFWKTLHDSHWIYPYDQFGNGPHDPVHLPENVRGLADDPYRSLAWVVREKGGFEKRDTPFFEFEWANFFRKNMKLHPTSDDFDAALKEAMELAKHRRLRGDGTPS